MAKRKPIYLPPGGGRTYAMGRLSSVFKADRKETASRYSISEWWLEANTRGPGSHVHDEDDVFYVLEGTMSIRIGRRWIDAERGSFVLVPGGVPHDFENRTKKRAGMLNISAPGGFEAEMPGIARWFVERAPANAMVRPTRRPRRVTGSA